MPAEPWCVNCLQTSTSDETCPACSGDVVMVEVHPAARENAKHVGEQLREWRSRQARIQRTDRFMVIPKRTFAALIAMQPESRETLRRVPGIGPAKDRDYGYVLTRYFQELHRNGAAEPKLARGPMPDGLSEDEEALVVEVREMRTPLDRIAEARGLPLAAVYARLADLVRRGCPDLAQILVAPAELEWISDYLESHPDADAAELAKALPATSEASRVLVPALLRAD